MRFLLLVWCSFFAFICSANETQLANSRLIELALKYHLGHWDNSKQVETDPRYTQINIDACKAKILGVKDKALFVRINLTLSNGKPFRNFYVATFTEDKHGQVVWNKFKFLRDQIADTEWKNYSESCLGNSSSAQQEKIEIDPQHILEKKCNMKISLLDTAVIATTGSEGCKSSFQGASKVVATDYVHQNTMIISERWYDSSNNQVAGYEFGPVIYFRKNY